MEVILSPGTVGGGGLCKFDRYMHIQLPDSFLHKVQYCKFYFSLLSSPFNFDIDLNCMRLQNSLVINK